MNTIIVIPTYNEKDNIQPLVEEILNILSEVTVLIVDDNSPDGTGNKSYCQFVGTENFTLESCILVK